MMVQDLIAELQKHDPKAEVILPGNHYGYTVFGITDVTEVEPARLTDGSTYSVVMLSTSSD